MPSDRPDFWNDRAEAEAREEWSPRDDMPTPDELPDVGTRIRPGRGVPFHEAMRALSPGVVVCDERAADCRCCKPAGHVEAGDDVHGCDPSRCTGQWRGVMDTPTFRVVRMPRAVGEPRRWDFA